MTDSRRRILERRASFVAAALATASTVACNNPLVCLKVAPADTGAGTDTGATDGGGIDASETDASVIDASEIDASEIDASEVEVGTVEAGGSDGSVDAKKAAGPKPKPRPCLSMVPLD